MVCGVCETECMHCSTHDKCTHTHTHTQQAKRPFDVFLAIVPLTCPLQSNRKEYGKEVHYGVLNKDGE